MKIALFSDVHANLPALESFFENIKLEKPDAMLELNAKSNLLSEKGISVQFIRVAYDVEKSAKAIGNSDFPNEPIILTNRLCN